MHRSWLDVCELLTHCVISADVSACELTGDRGLNGGELPQSAAGDLADAAEIDQQPAVALVQQTVDRILENYVAAFPGRDVTADRHDRDIVEDSTFLLLRRLWRRQSKHETLAVGADVRIDARSTDGI